MIIQNNDLPRNYNKVYFQTKICGNVRSVALWLLKKLVVNRKQGIQKQTRGTLSGQTTSKN